MQEISIIVPTNNSSKTIKKCLDSILIQPNIKEIICIDDASNDDTVSIIYEISHNCDKIVLLKNKFNMGPLYTRKKGVNYATGKYLMFVDSDDELYPNACAELYKKMEITNVDVIRFTKEERVISNGVEYNNKRTNHYLGFIKDDDLLSLQFKSKMIGGWELWRCIYKTDLCKKAFDRLKDIYILLGEDAYAMFYIMYYAKSYYGVENSYYIHNCVNGIASNKNIDYLMEHYCRAGVLHKDCVDFIKTEGKLDGYKPLLSHFPIFRMHRCIQMLSKVENQALYLKYCGMIYDAYKHVLNDECYFKKEIIKNDTSAMNKTYYDMKYHVKAILSILVSKTRK